MMRLLRDFTGKLPYDISATICNRFLDYYLKITEKLGYIKTTVAGWSSR